jgi:hypothetical protein
MYSIIYKMREALHDMSLAANLYFILMLVVLLVIGFAILNNAIHGDK